MTNLLPPEEKRNLLLRQKEKLVAVLGISVLVSLVCFILVLLSIKFYILAGTDYQKNILEQSKKNSQAHDYAGLDTSIQKYNKILSQIDSFYKKELYFNEALKIITDIPTPEGLYLTNFSINRSKEGSIQVRVAGTGDDRDGLLVFKSNVKGTKQIKNPYFSSESWISPKNVNFSLTFDVDLSENAK